MLNIKKIQDIMRNDKGVNGDAQRMEQIIWILFLKLYDEYERQWADQASMADSTYESIIPPECRWSAWAKDDRSGRALTGEKLLEFVNGTLFKAFKDEIQISKDTPSFKSVVKNALADLNNYQKDGVLLRQVINEIDQVELRSNARDKQEKLSEVYETFLKELQSAGNAGEFYTPRAVTDFVMQVLKPTLGDSIADFACGTGGFLISAFHYLEKNSDLDRADKIQKLENAFFGVEKKSLPFILCATSFLINGLEKLNIKHESAFDFRDAFGAESFENLSDEGGQFSLIAMNPPYGGSEKKETIKHFPANYASSETADLFVALILQKLKHDGRAAIVLPDGFLFGNDKPKQNLKTQLLNDFDLQLVVRLPSGVFAPYTSITTNILFFTKTPRGTKETWFYRLDMPEGIKSFGKTKQMKLEHFAPFFEWDKNRVELSDPSGAPKAKRYAKAELISRGYNLDLCGFVKEEEEILPPEELIAQIKHERARLNATLDSLMEQISAIVKDGAK